MTDPDDLAAMDAAIREAWTAAHPKWDAWRVPTEQERVAYRAGMVAGMLRAAERCNRAGAASFGAHPAFEDGCDHCEKVIRKMADALDGKK